MIETIAGRYWTHGVLWATKEDEKSVICQGTGMSSLPTFQSLAEAFSYCRDMDASLAERLDAFNDSTRYLIPGYQEAVDRLVARLKSAETGDSAPKPGEVMPEFILPDEEGRLVSLKNLLAAGPVAVVFHRGHWCPYCRINTRALAEAQEEIVRNGGQIVAIMPDREQFATTFKIEGNVRYPVLTDMDNGYALALNLAIWVGEEMQLILAAGDRQLPTYQGNESWVIPVPAAFVVRSDGIIQGRFIDPDYRRRMAVEDLLKALRNAVLHQ
jgi:peroxiredoxin